MKLMKNKVFQRSGKKSFPELSNNDEKGLKTRKKQNFSVSQKSSISKKTKSFQKTIMVVDDEEDIRNTVKLILTQNSYGVITAVNGEDCFKKLKDSVNPNLILMDIMMPGTPVSKIIPQIKNIPIAYLSVVRMSEAEKEQLLGQKNIVDFIQKPFDINELLERVKKIVD